MLVFSHKYTHTHNTLTPTDTPTPPPFFLQQHHRNPLNKNSTKTGRPPVVEKVGPFTFQMRTRKYDVTFSDRGRLVSYVQLTQHDFVGEPKELDQVGVCGEMEGVGLCVYIYMYGDVCLCGWVGLFCVVDGGWVGCEPATVLSS